MKKMLICLFAAVLAVSMMGCKGDVGSGSGEGGYNETPIGTKAPREAKAVGDIVFNDGSATPYTAELTLTDEQKSKAIAVIYKVDGSKAYGVGLVHNKTGLAWCLDSANGYGSFCTDIQCELKKESDGSYICIGDIDGNDNFTKLVQALGSNDDTGIAGNYPAFEFANNYKNQANSHVSGTIYEKGWYLPTFAELIDISKVSFLVDKASALCGGSEFYPDHYWSSVQNYYKANYALACYVSVIGGTFTCAIKYYEYAVCCIRVF